MQGAVPGVQDERGNGLGAVNRRLVALAAFAAMFLVGLDVSVISTAMPSVVGQLGGIQLYGWVFSSYLLTSTVTIPIYGKLADLYGRKPLFQVSTGLFLVGSMLCGQAQSMEQLILFRFIQGLGAGGVAPLTLVIIGDIFSLEQRARLMGFYSAAWGISALIGPFIGGFLTEQINWRWVFYVNLPFCLLSLAMMQRFLQERVARKRHRIDIEGALLLSAAVVALLFALSPVESVGGARVVPGWGLGLVSAALFGLFLRQERRAAEPMLPLDLFRRPIIGVPTLGAFMIGVALFSQSSFLPPFVQGVMGASPTVAGIVLSASSIAWPAASTVSGRLILRWGYRRVGLLGAATLLVGYLVLAGTRADDSLLRVVLDMIVIGAGFGLFVPVTTLAVQNAVPWQQRGVVTSASQFARSIGGTVGVSVAGAVFAAAVASTVSGGVSANNLLSQESRAALSPTQLAPLRVALADSLRLVYLLMAGVAGLALASALFIPRGSAEQHAHQADERPLEPAGTEADRALVSVRGG